MKRVIPIVGALLAVLAAMAALCDERVRGLAINTLLLCGSVVAIAVPSGFVLAAALVRTNLPGRRWLTATLMLALFMPLYLQASAWQAGFGQQGALVPYIGGTPFILGWPGTVWVHAMFALPWAVLFAMAALLSVEPTLEEMALLDMPGWKVFWRLTLPRTAPAMYAAAIWIAVMTASEMTVTNLFQVRTFAEELYTQLSLGESMAQIVLTGAPSWLFAGLLVCGGAVVIERFLAAARGTRQKTLVFELGKWRSVATILVWFTVFLLIGVPLVSLFWKVGLVVTAGEDGERSRWWSLEQCLHLVGTSPVRFGRELYWSLVLATSSATVATLLGVLLGWWARRSRPRRIIMLSLIVLGLTVPGPIVALTLIELLNEPGRPPFNWLYDQTLFAPCAALVVRSGAMATLIVWIALRRLTSVFFELAALDGLSTLRQLWQIALPLTWRAITAAWLAACAVAVGDLSATILVLPPGVDTIALRLFERLHYGAEDQVAAISLLLVLFFAALGFFTLALWNRSLRRPAK